MRIAKFIVVLGLAFLLASFLPSLSTLYGSSRTYGHFECFMVNGAGDLLVEVSDTANENISLYVLSYNDTLVLIQEDSLQNTTPLFQKENFVNFSGIIALPERGWYGIVVATNIVDLSTEETFIEVRITRPTPYLIPFLLFIISEVLGLGILLHEKIGNST